MRVALVHGEIGQWDGSSRYIVDVAALFARHGHQVTLLCEHCTRPLPDGLLSRSPGTLATQERFDLLYGSDLALLPALADRAPRFFYAPLDVLAASPERERWALQRCERVLRFTEPAVEILERTYGLSLEHKSLLAVYVSEEFEDLPEPCFERPRPSRLLWVGRLIASKNVAFLIRSAALLNTSDWRLVIAGDGPERSALLQLTRQLGLAGQVDFLGQLRDLGPHFDAASLFVTASRREHYSLTIMEAYARGLPCLGLATPPESRASAADGPTGEGGADSDFGGNNVGDDGCIFNACHEQILHGSTGYVIHDERELARRIDELLGDEDTRRAMALRGWQRKRDEFTNARFWAALQQAL